MFGVIKLYMKNSALCLNFDLLMVARSQLNSSSWISQLHFITRPYRNKNGNHYGYFFSSEYFSKTSPVELYFSKYWVEEIKKVPVL